MGMLRWVAVCAVAFLIGCGGGGPQGITVPAQSAPAQTALKSTLNDIAQTGELGSAADEIPGMIDELKSSDPDKAAALSVEYEKMKGMGSPDAIKSQAKKMADSL